MHSLTLIGKEFEKKKYNNQVMKMDQARTIIDKDGVGRWDAPYLPLSILPSTLIDKCVGEGVGKPKFTFLGFTSLGLTITITMTSLHRIV